MDYLTLKKISFNAGLVLFLIVTIGLLYFNDFDFDEYVFDFDENTLPFSVMSLFAGALMVYGMKTPEAKTTLGRCKIGAGTGVFMWLFLILSFFSAPRLDDLEEGLFLGNCVLLCISASALVFFAFKYSLKKEYTK